MVEPAQEEAAKEPAEKAAIQKATGEKARMSGWTVFRRVMSEQDSHWRYFALIILLGFLTVPLSLVSPYAIKIAVDSYLGTTPLAPVFTKTMPATWLDAAISPLILAISLVVATAILRGSISFARTILQTWTRERLVLGFRKRLFPHVERLSLKYHDEKGASDSTFRVLMDTAVIPAVVLDGLIPFLSSIALIVAFAIVIVSLSWKLALVAIAIGPILFFVSWPYGKKLRAQWHEIKELDSSAMSLLHEVFSTVRVIKAFGREEHETSRLVDVATKSMDSKVRVSLTQGRFDFWLGLAFAFGTAAVLGVGIYQVKQEELTLGEFVMVATLLGQFYSPLQLVVGQIASLQSSLASAERAMHLLDELPEVIEHPHARSLERVRGEVEYENVRFAYEDDNYVLRDVSFAVKPGEHIGIAGPTGSGKTTLMNLLMRLYDPSSGTIRIDGNDLRELKVADLRQQFSVVLQDPVLFKQSIAANIGYGITDATRESIVEAAKLANAHDFICSFPEGYDTVVGERGQRLSGGERQRISLARAFLKDSPILILDEPTSSVDIKTETAIMDACIRLMQGRTTFIIAHRPSTLETCDKVLVIQDGTIVTFASPDSFESLSELMLSRHA